MSDHNLAEALRNVLALIDDLVELDGADIREAREALTAHEAEQQAGEAVAIVELKTCGGNAGLSTRIKEIEDPMRDRLTAGTKLFTHPQQPLTEEQIRLERKRIDPMAEDMDAWSFGQGVRFAERAHGITKDTK